MSFKTPILCDRRVYDKRGKWKSPNNDIEENVFYFIKEPMTLIPSFDSYGREEMKSSITIVAFGIKPIIKEDNIKLESGENLKVVDITPNYAEVSPFLKDLLKPRIESIEITLE